MNTMSGKANGHHTGGENGNDAPAYVETDSGNSGDSGKDMSCLQKFSGVIMDRLENAFSTLGYNIGARPVLFLTISAFMCFLTGIGLLAFNEETRAEKLWVPQGSRVIDSIEWIDKNFPSTVVREQFIAVDSNILSATSIKALYAIYNESLELETSSGIKFEDVCVGQSSCVVYGILEVWQYKQTDIDALTDAQVLIDVNAVTASPMYGQEIEMDSYLGKISRDNAGSIVSARAASMTWLTEGNDETKDNTESWEKKFISLGRRGHSDLDETYVFAGRSYSDESGNAISSDVIFLTMGYVIVIVFVLCVLGNFNFREQRVWLTLGGFACIGLSILVAIGLSSAFQQDYGPLQSVLPFLLLGIGVDDMFVIIGALNNLSPAEQNCEVPELIAKVLGHAGVSITVTSITDFVAFMIGATTIIPALRSFCVYAGIGILALYFLQTTFFTACLAIDVRRIRANRDACCCCIRYSDDYQPNSCSKKQCLPFVFKKALAEILVKLPVKIVVIVGTLALFAVNVWGFVELEQYFNPNWFIPDDSYASEFLEAQESYFTQRSQVAQVYCGQLPYYTRDADLNKLDDLMNSFSYIKNGTTDSWFAALTNWLNTTSDASVLAKLNSANYPSSDDNFTNLTRTMTTSEIQRTSSYINYVSSSDNTIKASRFPFEYISMNDASTQIDAMDDTYDLVERAGFSRDECFPYSRNYLSWETNKVIQEELYRNLALAMVCVFIVGLVLIAHFLTTLYVFLGVIFTLVNTAGTMHFWGLTIDTVTSVILILSIGLAVDYSAHIGHMFMRIKGTREERVKETVREIGPPVFYGGFSTFLAFILLANSNSYVFRTFFKVNFLVVIYGLFHGLIFLPVLLSIAGPEPYPNATLVFQNEKKNNKVDKENGDGSVNKGFQREDKQASEMASLSNLPPLEKKYEINDPPSNGTSSNGISSNGTSNHTSNGSPSGVEDNGIKKANDINTSFIGVKTVSYAKWIKDLEAKNEQTTHHYEY